MATVQIRIILYELFLILIMSGCATNLNTSTDGTSRSQYIRNNLKNATVIIFVHGVTGDSRSSWTNEKTNAYWPEMLEKDHEFDDANIYVFEYPTAPTGRNATIHELADSMQQRLRSDNVLEHKRLIFLCHSMGGLITRQFLINYREQMANKILFAYFYSTPTEGSPMAMLWKLNDNPQFHDMYPMEVDNYLGMLYTQWVNSPLTNSVKSYCSYEIRKTYGLEIVSFRSAVGLCNQRITSINANHIDIVKPQDNHSDAYIHFKNAYNDSKNIANGDMSIRFVKPLLIKYTDNDKICKLKLLVDAVSNSDHRLAPKIVISRHVDQVYFEQEGISDEGYSLLEAHCPGLLRYELLDFCNDDKIQDAAVFIQNDYHAKAKEVMQYPLIDEIVNKDRNALVNDFKTGAIKLAIETKDGQVTILPEQILPLEVLDQEKYNNKHFMDKYIYRMENKYRRVQLLLEP